MQVEAFLVLNQNNEILMSCHCLQAPKKWPEYQDRLTKLVPSDLPKTETILLFDDIAIGVRVVGALKIMLTAPSASTLALESTMPIALNQFEKMLGVACQGEVNQTAIMDRDHYIRFQMLIQKEVSSKGYLRLDKQSHFEETSTF